MKISIERLNLELARKCMTTHHLRKAVSPQTIVKIRNGFEVNPATVGRIAKALEVDPSEIIEQEV